MEHWRSRWDALDTLAPSNPFAVVIMAQLQVTAYPDKSTRLVPLLSLTRRLYEYGYTRDQIQQLLWLVEWMIRLPPGLEPEYLLAAKQLEQEHDMSYVTIAERHGMAKGEALGLQKGLEQGLERGLERGLVKGQAKLLLRQIERRFGPVSTTLSQKIQAANSRQIETWSLNFVDATELDEVFRD